MNRLSNKNRDFLCWLAGFYEGEGSCGTYRKNLKYPIIQLSIYQKEIDNLSYIQKTLGFGSISKDNRGGHSYNITGKKAIEFIELVLPFMHSPYKISQINTALLKYFNKPMPERCNYPKKSMALLLRKRNSKGVFCKEEI